MNALSAGAAHRPVGRALLALGALAVLVLPVSPAMALGLGIAAALTVGDPFGPAARAWTSRLLAGSVVGLGAGMDLSRVARVGIEGLGSTAVGIVAALALGTWLGRRLKVRRNAALLVAVGTSICGGSAIAATAPAIGADDDDVSVALATVFVLNAVALVLFPLVGRALGLEARPFGLWCALAIHDTSSVVGAAASYGPDALEVATSAKLARALWIVPVTFALAAWARRRDPGCATRRRAATRRPWFIAGFLGAAALVALAPALRPTGLLVAAAAHRTLAVTLFGVGLGLSRDALRTVGARPFAQAATLWAALALGTLGAVLAGFIA